MRKQTSPPSDVSILGATPGPFAMSTLRMLACGALAAALGQTVVCLWDCNNPMFPKHFVLAALPHQYRARDKEPLENPVDLGTGTDLKPTATN